MKRLALAVTLLGAGAAGVAAAPAPPDRAPQARADALFEKAVARYAAGDYAAAIPMLEDAYALVHDPVYLFNIAQSYRKTFDCEHAADYYARYLAESTAPPNRGKVEQWLHELEPCVAERKDERARAAAAEAQARAADAAAKQAALDAAAAATPSPMLAPLPATAVDRGARLRLAGIVVGGAGIAALAVAGGFAHHGSTLEGDLAHACANGCNWDDVTPKDKAGDHANTVAEFTAVGGGLAVLTGATLYFIGRSSIEHVRIDSTRGGGLVSARFKF